MRKIALGFAWVAAAAVAGAQPLETCYRSPWGPNDQIGALNNITRENVLAAAKLVKRGKAIRMGIETNSRTPAFPPRTFSLTVLAPGQEDGRSFGETKTNYNDDIIMGWVGIGSQLDGLGHVGIDNVYYNCTRARDFVQPGGLTKFGIETVPAIATRAVILDMVGLFGKDPVPEGTAFNRKEIEAALKRQGNMKINKGDVVIFYTGWTKLIGKDDKRYASVEPGLGIEGARYLAELGVAMVGADNWGLEVLPFEDPKKIFHVHQILLAQHGIMILENVVAEEAVKDGVYEGLFTLGPPRITGAVQAIINPILVY
ncbi:MAG: cyclase family protein [Sutterellaceae bacterium]|nr:cyclase family protein [Burkholderiaceae bacterium]MCX7901139.1 cyclase family protein [Burkholderiaceae bacterium]MDW8430069.1 cyclase family protein [Sutterellaceae bacterium]